MSAIGPQQRDALFGAGRKGKGATKARLAGGGMMGGLWACLSRFVFRQRVEGRRPRGFIVIVLVLSGWMLMEFVRRSAAFSRVEHRAITATGALRRAGAFSWHPPPHRIPCTSPCSWKLLT
ncbi:hypothetical protein V8C44DRAFT_146805 [Trichoderma aethiopicum]